MQVKTALILCAGFGKRLNPLTLNDPKPLLNFHKNTLLEHTLILIKKLGIEKVKLNTFYLKEKIEKFIKNKNFDLDIEIVNDGKQILDTGGGIFNMIKRTSEENFLIFNPDTYWNDKYIDCIKNMENFYFNNNINNILLVVNKNLSFDKKLKGDFNLNKKIIDRKNSCDFIYTGCQILNKKIFSKVDESKFSINKLWTQLIEKKKLFGFESKNKFVHITDINIYNRLLKND